MKKLSFLIIAAALLVAGCSKDDDNSTTTAPAPLQAGSEFITYVNSDFGNVAFFFYLNGPDSSISYNAAKRVLLTTTGCHGIEAETYLKRTIQGVGRLEYSPSDSLFVASLAANKQTGSVIVYDTADYYDLAVAPDICKMRYELKDTTYGSIHGTSAHSAVWQRVYGVGNYENKWHRR